MAISTSKAISSYSHNLTSPLVNLKQNLNRTTLIWAMAMETYNLGWSLPWQLLCRPKQQQQGARASEGRSELIETFNSREQLLRSNEKNLII